MLRKWDKIWLNVFYTIGLVLLMIMVAFGQDWSQRFRLVWMISIILPIHSCEEWQMPGGFHYQYNLSFGSNYPNKYPMSRLTDMLTIVIAEVVYLSCLFFYKNTWVLMGLCGFGLLEVFVHTYFGISMYRRFKNKGKRTIYNPGLVSAYLGFGILSILMIRNIMMTSAISSTDWLLSVLMLLFMFVVEVFLPEKLFKNKNTQFGFDSPMYFKKFLDK